MAKTALPMYLMLVTNMTTKTIPIWNNLPLNYGCIKRRISIQKGFHLIFVYESTCDACVQACLADTSIASSIFLSVYQDWTYIFVRQSGCKFFFAATESRTLEDYIREEKIILFS